MGHVVMAVRLSGRCVSAQATPEYVVPKSMPTMILRSVIESLSKSMLVAMMAAYRVEEKTKKGAQRGTDGSCWDQTISWPAGPL